jgi:BirA family biotin operon repressor/biotin-[acetyl-CoA-carboxylase] ligase
VLVDGRKIAGILLESAAYADGRTEWMIIGIGINVASHPAVLAAGYAATCLAAERGGEVSRAAVRERLLQRLADRITEWRESGFVVIRRAWLARACGLHKSIRVNMAQETIAGTFVDLDPAGALVLATAEGPKTIVAGDVFVDEA